MAEIQEAGPGRASSVKRFAPFLVLAALQLSFLALVAPRSSTTTLSSSPGASTPDSFAGDGALDPAGGPAATGVGGGAIAESGSAGVGGTSAGAGSAAKGGGAKAGPGARVSTTGQKVDALGRPLEGDRSRCGKGGLIQDEVVSYSIPCTPKLEGDNGGATSMGVTKDEIVIVQYQFKADERINAALATQGLAASDQTYYEVIKIFEKFFNKHYEFYGRKIRYEQFIGTCDATDYACYRADAKALVKKFRPFAVERFQGPWQFADELSRAGVVVMGSSWGMPRHFFQERRPYVWDIFPDGETVSDEVASYWCKKLAGKPAEYANDPALRVKQRRLAILSLQDPFAVETANRLIALLDGGLCKGGARAQLYTISDDASKAQQELAPVISRMKADGITTVTNLRCDFTYNLLFMPVFDNQQFFPEHLLSGTGACDHDLVGRFATPTQRSAFFGNGFNPKLVPIEQQDDYKAVKEIDPSYNYDSYVLLASWIFNHNLMFLIQAAGPNLTPANLERGAFSLPQLGGWENPSPYPGWKCCDPLVTQHKYLPGQYAAHRDTRNVYWDDQAISVVDGKPGAYVCIDGCHRYTADKQTTAKPK